jgi:hypothetical protein
VLGFFFFSSRARAAEEGFAEKSKKMVEMEHVKKKMVVEAMTDPQTLAAWMCVSKGTKQITEGILVERLYRLQGMYS